MAGIDAYTKLVIHANGPDGGTNFYDDSNTHRTVTPVGNAQVSTAEKKYGTGSLLLDGSGDRLDIVDSATDPEWSFGTNDFTIDFWVRPESAKDYGDLMGSGYDGGFHIYMGQPYALVFEYNNANQINVAAEALTVNQ